MCIAIASKAYYATELQKERSDLVYVCHTHRLVTNHWLLLLRMLVSSTMVLEGALLNDLLLRERGEQSCRAFRRRQQFREADIQKLNLDHELQGHQECVNCLNWNEDGTLLASGSDDTRCCIWDPFLRRKVTDVETGHEANIFSVNFVPQSNSALIATCAGDGRVKVWDINHRVQIYDDRSHFSRVKRLASAGDTPSVFWSAGEDGLVIQHDLRESSHQHSRDGGGGTRRALISMLAHTYSHECKCLAVNPVHTHLLALGSNDIYVRLFDRRMLSPKSTNARDGGEFLTFFRDAELFPLPKGCVRYYTAGYLPSKYTEANDSTRRRSATKSVSTTFVAFSRDGAELLANYNAGHIYLFDVHGGVIQSRQFLPPLLENGEPPPPFTSRNGFMVVQTKDEDALLEAAGVKDMKDKANELFHQKNYFEAIKLYNLALKKCTQSSVLWSNRSAALMKRKHEGDIYEALLNAYRAFCLNSMNDKACFRIIRNLIDLRRFDEARQWLAYLKRSPNPSTLIESSSIHRVERELDEHFNTVDASAGSMKTNNTGSRPSSRSSTDADSTTSTPSPSSSSSSTDTSNSEAAGEGSGISLITASRTAATAASRLSEAEKYHRSMAFDYSGRRFTGHCNTNTDIKEACFIGGSSQFVIAGSDDGCFYVWDKQTTNIVRAMKADSSIVNCCAVHPDVNMLATSGIDNVVRLWTPSSKRTDDDDGDSAKQRRKNLRDSGPDSKNKPVIGDVVQDYAQASESNAKLMARDPFERIFLNMRDDMFPIDMILAAANRARANNNRRRRAAGAGVEPAGGDAEDRSDHNDDGDDANASGPRGGNNRVVVPMQCSQQ